MYILILIIIIILKHFICNFNKLTVYNEKKKKIEKERKILLRDIN